MKRNRILVSVMLVAFFTSCKKEKKRICELYDGEVDYAIGEIESVTGGVGKATYTYSFEANGNSYNGMEKAYGIGQMDKSLVGKPYVVVYELGHPDNSDMNFDFEITSEADFQDFQSEYSEAPPAPDYPNNCN